MPRADTSVLLALAAAIVALAVASSVAASAPGTTTSSTASVVHPNEGKLFSLSGAAANGQALEPLAVSTPWFGGAAPRITAVDVIGEFLDQRSGLYHLRAKAIVRRLGADRNGRITLLRARTWRDALDQIDAVASSNLGLSRGTTAAGLAKVLGYSRAELRRPFPDLKASVSYEILVSVDGRGTRASNPAARRARDSRSFVEPLSIGLPPGTHAVGVVGCSWPDETHPLTKPYAKFVRGLLVVAKLGAAAKVIATLVSVATGGPAGALAQQVATALAVQLGQSFAMSSVTCGASGAKVTVRLKMPNVVGEDQDDALRELRARSVKVDIDADIVRRASCDGFQTTVKRQSPAFGAFLAPGQTVFILVTHCVESALPPPATATYSGEWTWNATNDGTGGKFEGSMTIVQAAGKVCASWSFSGSGTAKGPLNGRKWHADWYDGFGAGTWDLVLSVGGTRFDGKQTIKRHSGGAQYTATIVGTRESSTPAKKLNCDTLKVGP